MSSAVPLPVRSCTERRWPRQSEGVRIMNMSHNLARDIANAELAGDAALLAAIARDLLTLQRGNSEQRTVKKKAAPKGKSAGHEYLTRTELLALGLKPFKESKISG